MKKMEEQDIVQAVPTISVIDKLKDEVSRLSEKNSKEHGKFSKDIQALDKKLDEMLEAQRREKRKEEVEKFVKESDLGFKIYAGTFYDGIDHWARLWIKIPNKDKTDFNYILITDIPVCQNYFNVKIFEGKTYNPPYLSPRGNVLIAISFTAKADGNGYIPIELRRFWFDIDKQEVAIVKDFDDLGDYFSSLEIITGRNFDRIYKKIKMYTAHPTDKNLCFNGKVCMYDYNKEDFYRWEDREEM